MVQLRTALTSPQRPGLTYASGYANDLRDVFIITGALPDTVDTTFRTVSDRWPALAFSHQLGPVLTMSAPTVLAVGQARENIALYAQGENQQIRAAYYLKKYASAESACDAFMRDWQHMFDVSKDLDEQILRDAGPESEAYSGLVQLSLRQAIAGMELTIARKADGSIDANDVMLFTAGEFGSFLDESMVLKPFPSRNGWGEVPHQRG